MVERIGGNMKRFLLATLLLCLSVTLWATPVKRQIVLQEGKFFNISDVFTDVIADDFTRFMLTTNEKEVYIFINSPGGEVIAMSRMIGILRASKVKTICVAQFAASAAFMFFENCTERLMTFDGVIMSHNAAGGFQDEFPRIESLFSTLRDLVDNHEKVVARRMKLDFKEYKRLINNNLWMTIQHAFNLHATDGITTVTCPKSLVNASEVRDFTQCSFMGCISTSAEFSKCPLIYNPIKKGNTTEAKSKKVDKKDFWVYVDR